MTAGYSGTPLARKLSLKDGMRTWWDGMPESVQQSLSASIPFPSRLGKPEEFADLVAYILGNTYLNGETIRLDGATRLAAK